MEANYTVAELRKMLAEAETKEMAEKEMVETERKKKLAEERAAIWKERVETERKKKLAEERAARWKEVVEAERKYHDLYSKFYQDYKISNGSVVDLLDYMLGGF